MFRADAGVHTVGTGRDLSLHTNTFTFYIKHVVIIYYTGVSTMGLYVTYVLAGIICFYTKYRAGRDLPLRDIKTFVSRETLWYNNHTGAINRASTRRRRLYR